MLTVYTDIVLVVLTVYTDIVLVVLTVYTDIVLVVLTVYTDIIYIYDYYNTTEMECANVKRGETREVWCCGDVC
jgi:hypothetical protein